MSPTLSRNLYRLVLGAGIVLGGGLFSATAIAANPAKSEVEAQAAAKRSSASDSEECTAALVNKCLEECPVNNLCREGMSQRQCSAEVVRCMGESEVCKQAANNGDGCNERLSSMDAAGATTPTFALAGAGRAPKKDDPRLKCSLAYERGILACFIWFKDKSDNANGDKKSTARAKAEFDLCMKVEALGRKQCLGK